MNPLYLHFRDYLTPTAVVHTYVNAMDPVEGHPGGILSKTEFIQDSPNESIDRAEQPETDLFRAFLTKQASATIEDDLYF